MKDEKKIKQTEKYKSKQQQKNSNIKPKSTHTKKKMEAKKYVYRERGRQMKHGEYQIRNPNKCKMFHEKQQQFQL